MTATEGTMTDLSSVNSSFLSSSAEEPELESINFHNSLRFFQQQLSLNGNSFPIPSTNHAQNSEQVPKYGIDHTPMSIKEEQLSFNHPSIILEEKTKSLTSCRISIPTVDSILESVRVLRAIQKSQEQRGGTTWSLSKVLSSVEPAVQMPNCIEAIQKTFTNTSCKTGNLVPDSDTIISAGVEDNGVDLEYNSNISDFNEAISKEAAFNNSNETTQFWPCSPAEKKDDIGLVKSLPTDALSDNRENSKQSVGGEETVASSVFGEKNNDFRLASVSENIVPKNEIIDSVSIEKSAKSKKLIDFNDELESDVKASICEGDSNASYLTNLKNRENDQITNAFEVSDFRRQTTTCKSENSNGIDDLQLTPSPQQNSLESCASDIKDEVAMDEVDTGENTNGVESNDAARDMDLIEKDKHPRDLTIPVAINCSDQRPESGNGSSCSYYVSSECSSCASPNHALDWSSGYSSSAYTTHSLKDESKIPSNLNEWTAEWLESRVDSESPPLSAMYQEENILEDHSVSTGNPPKPLEYEHTSDHGDRLLKEVNINDESANRFPEKSHGENKNIISNSSDTIQFLEVDESTHIIPQIESREANKSFENIPHNGSEGMDESSERMLQLTSPETSNTTGRRDEIISKEAYKPFENIPQEKSERTNESPEKTSELVTSQTSSEIHQIISKTEEADKKDAKFGDIETEKIHEIVPDINGESTTRPHEKNTDEQLNRYDELTESIQRINPNRLSCVRSEEINISISSPHSNESNRTEQLQIISDSLDDDSNKGLINNLCVEDVILDTNLKLNTVATNLFTNEVVLDLNSNQHPKEKEVNDRKKFITSSWDLVTIVKLLYSIREPQAPKTFSEESNFQRSVFILSKGAFSQYEEGHYIISLQENTLHVLKESEILITVPLKHAEIEVENGKLLKIDNKLGRCLFMKCDTQKELLELKKQLQNSCLKCWLSECINLVHYPLKCHQNIIIIDLGSCSTRAGILMDEPTLPALFFPSVCATNKITGEHLYGMDALQPEARQSSTISFPIRPSLKIIKHSIDIDQAAGIFKKIFRDLRISPEKFAVHVCLPRSLSTNAQNDLVKVLLEDLNVQAVSLAHQAILTMYAHNVSTGIVVDIGDRMDILPVIDGFIVEAGVTRLPYGGQRLIHHMKHALAQKHISLSNDIDSFVVQYITENLSYIADDFAKEEKMAFSCLDTVRKSIDLQPFSKDENCLKQATLDDARFKVPEGFFNPDLWGLDCLGVHKLVQKAIQAASVDARKKVAENIYVSGGVTLIPGFVERLTKEVTKLNQPRITPKVFASNYRYHSTYIGACRFARMDVFPEVCVTKDEYYKNKHSSLKKFVLCV